MHAQTARFFYAVAHEASVRGSRSCAKAAAGAGQGRRPRVSVLQATPRAARRAAPLKGAGVGTRARRARRPCRRAAPAGADASRAAPASLRRHAPAGSRGPRRRRTRPRAHLKTGFGIAWANTCQSRMRPRIVLAGPWAAPPASGKGAAACHRAAGEGGPPARPVVQAHTPQMKWYMKRAHASRAALCSRAAAAEAPGASRGGAARRRLLAFAIRAALYILCGGHRGARARYGQCDHKR